MFNLSLNQCEMSVFNSTLAYSLQVVATCLNASLWECTSVNSNERLILQCGATCIQTLLCNAESIMSSASQ